MMIRKILAAVLALVLAVSFVGCGSKQRDISTDDCAGAMLQAFPEPVFGSVGGEWMALGLARWGGSAAEAWLEGYYEQVEAYVVSCEGVLDEKKYTEYSRVILALTAIGKDPADVGGYNLLLPLEDYEQTIFQGINGAAFALLALDCGGYEIPENTAGGTQATRELYVQYILDTECPGGGWTLAGSEPDVDITAMVLQALAGYQHRADVAEATQRALTLLSGLQNEAGGFTAYGSESSESISQVIVALTELGISLEDSRFVKNGNTLRDRLLDFMAEDYGFRHLLEGEVSQLSTEQAFYALVAAERAARGDAPLYKMK